MASAQSSSSSSKAQAKEAMHVKMELYDRDALRVLLVHPGVRDECKALLAKYPKLGRGMDSKGDMAVKYRRAVGGDGKDDGRVYADRGAQGMDGEVRAELCHKFYHDIDMVNAHPTLILWHARKEGWPCDRLASYVEDRDATLERVKEYYNVERPEAKQLFCCLMFGGGLKKWEETNGCERHDMPELVALKREFKGLLDRVWEKYPKKETFKAGSTEHDKKATNMSAWVCGHEYATLMVMHSVAMEMGESPDVLIHDGLMIRKRPALDEDRLAEVMRGMEARVKERLGYDIKLVEKKMQPLRTLDMTTTKAPSGSNVSDEVYAECKRRFEEKHFKIIRPCSFGTICEDGTAEFCRREEFMNRHEDFPFIINGKPESFLKVWLADPTKRSYAGKDFRPFPEDADLPDEWFNLFTGFAAERIPENDAADVSIEPFLDHVRLLCGDVGHPAFDASVDYLLSYFAHMMQFPGKKPDVSIILHGPEGSGKSKFVAEMGRLMGESLHYTTSKVSDVLSEFSVARAGKVLVQLEEAAGAHTNKVMEFLKDMITGKKCNATRKYEMQTTQLACDRLVITTNNADCMAVTTESRRFVAFGSSSLRCRDRPYWSALHDWYDVPVNRRAVFDYLRSYPGVSNKDWVNDRPRTEASLRMSEQALPLIMHFLAMATQLTHDVPSRTGDEWFEWFRLFEESEHVASRDVLTKRVFLCQLKDLDKNAATGVVYNRSRKARTYSVDAEIFTIYAASLGLTDAPALIPYLGSSSS
jgi:hypothetical protein